MIIENLRRGKKTEGSSDRFFGLLFALIFLVIACFPLLHSGSVHSWALVVSGSFFSLSLVLPRVLAPLNKAWMHFGLLLGCVVGPIALGVVYLISVVPVGLVLRAMGKDPLSLKFDRSRESYWIPREPGGYDPKSMKKPF